MAILAIIPPRLLHADPLPSCTTLHALLLNGATLSHHTGSSRSTPPWRHNFGARSRSCSFAKVIALVLNHLCGCAKGVDVVRGCRALICVCRSFKVADTTRQFVFCLWQRLILMCTGRDWQPRLPVINISSWLDLPLRHWRQSSRKER